MVSKNRCDCEVCFYEADMNEKHNPNCCCESCWATDMAAFIVVMSAIITFAIVVVGGDM